jgi:hypothetical protein
LTVSLIVCVPSCARAALSASSSMSTRCFATLFSIYDGRSVYTSGDRREDLGFA